MRVGRVLVLLAVMSTSLVLAAQPASASCFSGEQALFIAASGITTGTGATNWIHIRGSRALDTSCPNPATGSTSQVGSPTFARQVEVGWTKRPNSSTVHWFWEAQHSSLVWGGCCQAGSDITSHAGEDWGWRVSYHDDDQLWHVYINRADGNGYTEIWPLADGWTYGHGIPGWLVDMTSGRPKGETNRFGGTGTSAFDHHFDLTYRGCQSGACWSSWPNNYVQNDGIPGWHWVYVAPDEYNVRADS